MLSNNPGEVIQVFQGIQEIINSVSQLVEKNKDTPLYLPLLKQLIRAVKISGMIKVAWFLHQESEHDLQFVAQFALALIRYNYRDHGITRDADSFRVVLEKSDLNSLTFREPLYSTISDPLYPFIASRQWTIIEPLLPPSDHAGRRGRPPADPRELLDAVFWKFAHHARWQDLPTGYPPILTCRRYYRRLFLSGRLATIYSALYKDFLTRGKADLNAFVKQGCFTITENKVILRAGLDDTWQMRTALLFMQQGVQVLRRLRREQEQEQRCRFPSFRMPSMRSLQSPVAQPVLATGSRPVCNEAEFSFTPIDLANLGPQRRK
jgi:transposase